MESHLLQMRGLKQNTLISSFHNSKSHLLQMRGLKLVRSSSLIAFGVSHLLQMRGLKHRDAAVFKLQQGRIFYRCVD